MSAEATLYTLLSPLVAGRVLPDVAKEGTDLPRIVYQQVGGVAEVFTEGALPDQENGRMQIACWATTRTAAVALARLAEAALVTATAFQAEPVGARISVYEEDTQLYGTRQDFSIWSPR